MKDRHHDLAAFGTRLREARARRQLTQDEVAALAGISRYTLSLYENGRRAPTADVLPRVARAVAASYDELLGPVA